MGGGLIVAVAVPIGATFALLALLGIGMVGVQLARRLRDDEPLFPDLATAHHDPVRFTERLADAGNLADETARFAEVAAHSGFDQAYALLSMADTDSGPTRRERREAARGPLATLTALADDDRRLADYLARTTSETAAEIVVPTPVAPEPAPARTPIAAPTPDVAIPGDDLLPSRRRPRVA